MYVVLSIIIAILVLTVLFLLVNARTSKPDGFIVVAGDTPEKKTYRLEFDDDVDLDNLDTRKRLVLAVRPVLEDRS